MTSDHRASTETTPFVTTPRIEWLPWNTEAFARAAAARKPVLLSITAAWCHGCDVMDRITYGDAAVAEAIASGFVAIRVDADRRPDINARYNLEGWPTTAVLTPSGEILTGGTYVGPAEMIAMLASTSAALRDDYDALMMRADRAAHARRAARAAARYEPDLEAPRWLLTLMVAEHDRECGGFGTGGKFLNAPLLAFGIELYRRTGDEEIGKVVTRTLDAIAWSPIFDEVDGGFFRYAAGRDFTRPHTEKLLEDQMALVPVLLDAARAFGRAAYRERARDVIRFVRRTLCDPAGGFFASQRPDAEFYALNGSIRESMQPPAVDRTLFADLNAQAIVAWLHAAEVLGDPSLAAFAATVMGRIVDDADLDEGVAHWTGSDAPRDLLTDQVHVGWALIHIAAATGDHSCIASAAQLMRTLVRRFWDQHSGGFLDRAGDVEATGLLADPVKPLQLNSLAARVLWRLASLTDDDDLRVRARQTLGAMTGSYRSQGLNAAPYGLAVGEILW